MVSKLMIDNLKSIDHIEFPCTNMNLFVGTNSSGKSTILQTLLLIAQKISYDQGLSGEYVSLGSFDEAKCISSGRYNVTIKVEDFQGESLMLQIQKADKTHTATCQGNDEIANCFDIKKRRIQYLSCHRIGPQNLYMKNVNLVDLIGTDGSYAMSYLNMHASEQLESSICKDSQDYTLRGQVNWWLKYIVGAEVSTEEIIGADMIRASYSMGRGFQIRPQNIGSGISYLISIIILCLSSPKESIIVLENPEIHLHPTAQSKLCEFLYFISTCNRQLFVETHSDHIFNGFRAGISTGEILDEQVNINFVSLKQDYTTQIEKVRIGRFGKIENQRRDLFDQFDIDLNKMIGV